MLTNMPFPCREGWEIPGCLLVWKTVWDAFQDFPKRKALFFFAGVVGGEWRADCRGCASHVCPRPRYLWSSYETNKLLNLALAAGVSLLPSLLVKTLILWMWSCLNSSAHPCVCGDLRFKIGTTTNFFFNLNGWKVTCESTGYTKRAKLRLKHDFTKS